MGFSFYPLDTRPNVFDVVWSKWPRREDKLAPGPWVRPVLVLAVTAMVDERTGQKFAAVTAQYGGDFEAHHVSQNLLITAAECRDLGLHKPTVFRLDLGNRKRLPWCEEYFITQGYVRSQKLISGSLNRQQQELVLSCLKGRGLEFPLPVS